MAKRIISVEGYEALKQILSGKTKNGSPVFIHLSGGIDSNTGKSWCPDCVTADPVISAAVEKLLKKSDNDYTFVHCSVGPRDAWKDANNAFRTDADLKATGVPTLLLWNQNKRLVEAQCANSDLVEMLFEEALG